MNTIVKYLPSIAAALILGCVVAVLFPYCRYYIDPDATAYLTIAKRYAEGDMQRAVNGYWSPWSCWLTALLTKGGMSLIASAIIANTVGAACLLQVSQSLLVKYRVVRSLQWLMNVTLALFLAYAVYKQTFDDIWECFFLLYVLRILVSGGFKHRRGLWVLAGVVGALAYFAKAYSFPFFILNVLCCVFFITRAWVARNVRAWLLICGITIGTMLVISSPWIYMLHGKYGIWTTSTAGTLNTSWFLVGHPYWKAGIRHILPPVYDNSPSHWEDPWIANGSTPHFYDSIQLFILQLVRVGYNVLKFVRSAGELSAFFMFVWLIALGFLCSRKMRCFFAHNKLFLPVLSFMLFPLGFMLINFEPRYIWYMLPLSMLFGALVIQKMQKLLAAQPVYNTLIPVVFALSYMVTPVWEMRQMAAAGKQDYELARQLSALHIRGSFTANAVFGGDALITAQRVGYFNGMQFYNMPYADVPAEELLSEMHRYKVQYYFYFYNDAVSGRLFELKDDRGNAFNEVTAGKIPGLKVFSLR